MPKASQSFTFLFPLLACCFFFGENDVVLIGEQPGLHDIEDRWKQVGQ